MKIIIHYLMVIGLILILFVSCDETPKIQYGNVHGIVTDKESGEPIASASITISPLGKSTSTGSDGRYEYNNIEVGQYTVQAIANNYDSNSKSVTITLMETAQCDIQLTPALPVLKVSKEKLSFDINTSNLSFDVTNTGKNTLTWSISETADWLVCSPTTGNTTTQVSSVVATVSRNGMKGGTYNDNIIVTSNGGSVTIPVSMEIQKVNTKLSVSPEQLDFSKSESVLELTLANESGSGSIEFTANSSNGWIIIDKTSGSVTTKEYIIVSVNRTNLSAGSYSGSVVIRVDQEDISIPVKMEVTSEQKPAINMSDVSEITYNSGLLKASIISVGSSNITKHGFCWSTEENPVIDDDSKSDLGDCSKPKNYEYNLINLEPNTKYYVRAYAVNSIGASYSPEKTFITKEMPTKPTVVTDGVSNISINSATASGTISSLGNLDEVSEHGHIWSTNEKNITITNNTKSTLGKKSETGSFSSTMDGLKHSTTYYVRAYATNTEGTAYGEIKSFITATTTPIIVTNDAENIGMNKVTLSGNILDNGGIVITSYGFLWGESMSDLNNRESFEGEVIGKISKNIEGLHSVKKYFYKIYATNEKGTSYGDIVEFTTKSVNDSGYGDDFNNNEW